MQKIFHGYEFRNTALFNTALTHRSAGRENNERLEFLGDAILGFVIADILYEKFPHEAEGVLTRLRASLVKRDTLAQIARQHDLGASINLGPGEKKSGGWRRDSILANTLESIIGAVYLDSDITDCREFVLGLYDELLLTLEAGDKVKDPKTALQEYLQSRKHALPEYQVIAEQGQSHKRIFTVSCTISELGYSESASGKSKRIAEQSAAARILKLIAASGQ